MMTYMTRDVMTAATTFDEVQLDSVWAYRENWRSPLQKVTVVAFPPVVTRTPRITVRFVSGGTEDIPFGRLKTLWENEPAYTAAVARWDDLEAPSDADQAAIDAAEMVADELLPAETAETMLRVEGALSIHDLSAFSALTGLLEQELTGHPDAFTEEGRLYVPWAVTKLAVANLAERNADAVAALALDAEKRAADFEESHRACDYTRDLRDRAKQLRAWCGVAAITVAEENQALKEQLDEMRRELLNAKSVARQAIELVNKRHVAGKWVEQNVSRLEAQLEQVGA
jgi:hypothetical protein